jgi:hypothetical protein
MAYALPPLAAILMAALIRRYVPHRHRFPDIAVSICASVGRGVLLRSAEAAIN